MAKKQPPTEEDLRKAASRRQKEYTMRLREQGYAVLSGLYVPAAIRAECRALVKKHVAKWEKAQAKF